MPETGRIVKGWQNRLTVALVYPNNYRVGNTNLGLQAVYRLLNNMETVVCERAFLSEGGKSRPTRSLKTVESGRALVDFDIVAFSVSFELDYLHILTILDLAGIPLRSEDRNNLHPLVVAGGVACWINPEPIAPFFDLIFIGEAEALLLEFINSYKKDYTRSEYISSVAHRIPGVYVPALYQPRYDGKVFLGHQRVTDEAPLKVQRQVLPDLVGTSTHTQVVSSQSVFDSRFLIEIGRGCAHGCRFCSAGFISRPPRFRDISTLVKTIEKGQKVADRIGLVGTAVTDLPGLDSLCRHTSDREISLAFSSFRANGLIDEFVQALAQSGVQTATIAPDAGSERMRKVINKGLYQDEILNCTAALVAAGIANLKLYFMVGLPFENDEDVLAIVTLTQAIKKIFLQESRPQGHIGKITVSLNCFVPKPFTPFQWASMDRVSRLKKKIMAVRKGIGRIPNLVFRSESPRQAYLQTILSRGDRRVSEVLMSAHRNGGDWFQALARAPFDPDEMVYRDREVDTPLPWDVIDIGVRKSFLIKEYEKARQARSSLPCPIESCTLCGVC